MSDPRRRTIVAGVAAAALAPPARTFAQTPGRTYRLAILTPSDPLDPSTGRRQRQWASFFDELHRLGYVEHDRLVVAWHSSDLDASGKAALVQRVAESRPDAIFAPDTQALTLLRGRAASIPVVTVSQDPVGSGVADSLARPGGNITGFTTDVGTELVLKRFQLIGEVVGPATTIGWLNPRRVLVTPGAIEFRQKDWGIPFVDVALDAPVDESAYRRAFAALAGTEVRALYVGPSAENRANRRLIADLALEAKLPTVFGFREDAEAGGLISYGVDLADIYRRAAGYLDRILRGADPATMPFQQPTRFELVVNLRTAKALGLTLPPTLIAIANEVIE